MSPLRSALRQYVAMRRGLGYKFQHQERRLTDFVTFMECQFASNRRWAPKRRASVTARASRAAQCEDEST